MDSIEEQLDRAYVELEELIQAAKAHEQMTGWYKEAILKSLDAKRREIKALNRKANPFVDDRVDPSSLEEGAPNW